MLHGEFHNLNVELMIDGATHMFCLLSMQQEAVKHTIRAVRPRFNVIY